MSSVVCTLDATPEDRFGTELLDELSLDVLHEVRSESVTVARPASANSASVASARSASVIMPWSVIWRSTVARRPTPASGSR
jgi:hypothetical protein